MFGFSVRCALPAWRNNPDFPSSMRSPSKIAPGRCWIDTISSSAEQERSFPLHSRPWIAISPALRPLMEHGKFVLIALVDFLCLVDG
jgi:hypothetical protein